MIALTIMQNHQAPMVVLLDLVMPRLDGTSVLHLVRQDAGLSARNVFIVMTAAQRNLPDTLVPVLQELLISVLYKPFELNELLQFVSEAASRLPPT
jgi:CheY-like chemotaxis protein